MAESNSDHPWRQAFEQHQCLLPELKMVGYDRFPRAEAARLAAHAHDGYEICYLVSGSVEWWAGDEVTEVGPGEIYLTRPGERHGGIDAFMHPCELYWVQVAMPLTGLPANEANELAVAFGEMRRRTFAASAGPVNRLCRQILDEHLAPDRHAVVAVRAAVAELCVRVVRDHEAATAAARGATMRVSNKIRAALNWMDHHAHEDYTVDDAATFAGLKPSRFHERFVAETGFTPAEYRTRQRIVKAKQLLRSGHRRGGVAPLSVTEIAFALGFSTSQYFATVFKNQVGLTPGEYRDRAGKSEQPEPAPGNNPA
jgi:AraC family L-rhamnose operon regulatory protein RhaS